MLYLLLQSNVVDCYPSFAFNSRRTISKRAHDSGLRSQVELRRRERVRVPCLKYTLARLQDLRRTECVLRKYVHPQGTDGFLTTERPHQDIPSECLTVEHTRHRKESRAPAKEHIYLKNNTPSQFRTMQQPRQVIHGQGTSLHRDMLWDSDQISWIYTTAAAGFSSVLLAGYLISPSTYASISHVGAVSTGKVETSVMMAVHYVPLIVVASVFCFIASAGLGWLWWKCQHNYYWVKRNTVV